MWSSGAQTVVARSRYAYKCRTAKAALPLLACWKRPEALEDGQIRSLKRTPHFRSGDGVFDTCDYRADRARVIALFATEGGEAEFRQGPSPLLDGMEGQTIEA